MKKSRPNTLESIYEWHVAARNKPRVQMGCHFEEVAEMLDALVGVDPESKKAIADAAHAIRILSDGLKRGALDYGVRSRVDLLDAVCDQIVTAVGVAVCERLNLLPAVAEVDASNWSKFVNGRPLKDANGKVVKGPDYRHPDLAAFAQDFFGEDASIG